jgi:hypothetical protein
MDTSNRPCTYNRIYLLFIHLMIVDLNVLLNKSLKSESVNRRTDNTMAKKIGQNDKQRSTKHTHKTKDRVTRTPLVMCIFFRLSPYTYPSIL